MLKSFEHRPVVAVFTMLLLTGTFTMSRVSAQTPDSSSYLAPFAVTAFYQNRPESLLWSSEAITDLIAALQRLDNHGLNPEHYHINELRSETNPQLRDRLATDAWFSAAAHMLYGKLDPLSVEPDWTASKREADLAGILEITLNSGRVLESFEQFAPSQKGYQTLLTAYNKLKSEAEIQIVTVTPGTVLKTQDTGERVERLQQRLVQLELLEPELVNGNFDLATLEAVKMFQEGADLDPDGMAGPITLAALNLGYQEKLNKLRVNLERWRWLPDELGQRHLRANIAGFNVTAWENGEPVRTHLTIVGKNYRKTPVFSDEIEYIIFNPWWEVPASIARTDKLPLLREDPSLLTDLGFEVLDQDGKLLDALTIDWHAVRAGTFPYRLRQSPGLDNALGQVKIMFPNSHNVYLHDTPNRGLFAQRQRAFSSGCLRTEFPLDLAAWLLEETPEWNPGRIAEVVGSGKETRVNLTNHVPVHILYFTVVAEDRAGVRYLDDIYQRDEAVLAGLRTAHQ